jgi:uncharacterized membrane protein YphA (DoxX/SURF4 family)
MNIILWILQFALGGLFLAAGGLKVARTKEQMLADPRMGEQMGYLNDFTQEQVRGIGVAEVLAGIALILPMLLGILKVFTPLAAFALAVHMSGAAYTHYRRNEQPPMLMTIGIAVVALFLFLGRISFESVV